MFSMPMDTGSAAFGVTELHIECAALSDQGRIRTSNEDSFIANRESNVFLVADGMGGHAAGEVASRIAAAAVDESVAAGVPDCDMPARLQMAVAEANSRVYQTQKLDPECRGMGSTLTVLAITGSGYYIAQVGDSRAYLYRDGELAQLTRDHSLVWPLYEAGMYTKEELSHHPRKNLITRSIGTQPQVEPELRSGTIVSGDVFLLCSDGLTDVLSDADILTILSTNELDPQKTSERLVEAANSGGGPDNITVVVVHVE